MRENLKEFPKIRQKVQSDFYRGKRGSRNSFEDYPEFFTRIDIDVDRLSLPEEFVDFLLPDAVREALERQLTIRECTVLRLFFGLFGEQPVTLKKISKKFKISTERTRQVKEEAMEKLKCSFKEKVCGMRFGRAVWKIEKPILVQVFLDL